MKDALYKEEGRVRGLVEQVSGGAVSWACDGHVTDM